jgi:hypothetical protein
MSKNSEARPRLGTQTGSIEFNLAMPSHQPCFAVASQFDKGGKIPSGVNEYILYLTDGVLIILFLTLVVGLVFVIATMIVYVPSPDRSGSFLI